MPDSTRPGAQRSLYPDGEGVGNGTGVGSWRFRWKLALARLLVIEVESDMQVEMDMGMQAVMGRRFQIDASLPRLSRRFHLRWRRDGAAEA